MNTSKDPLLRRLGRFRIPDEIIQSHPEIVMDFMNTGFLVLEAIHRWDCMAVEYLAIHHIFPERPHYLVAPTYELEIAIINNGTEESPKMEPQFLPFNFENRLEQP